MTDTPDLAAIAKEVSTVDEAIMRVLPFIAPLLGFIPGAAVAEPFLPLVGDLLTALDNAAKAVAAGNPGAAATDILQELINHLTPGQPNSPALGPAAAA
jgi:hypothetical protein